MILFQNVIMKCDIISMIFAHQTKLNILNRKTARKIYKRGYEVILLICGLWNAIKKRLDEISLYDYFKHFNLPLLNRANNFWKMECFFVGSVWSIALGSSIVLSCECLLVAKFWMWLYLSFNMIRIFFIVLSSLVRSSFNFLDIIRQTNLITSRFGIIIKNLHTSLNCTLKGMHFSTFQVTMLEKNIQLLKIFGSSLWNVCTACELIELIYLIEKECM